MHSIKLARKSSRSLVSPRILLTPSPGTPSNFTIPPTSPTVFLFSHLFLHFSTAASAAATQEVALQNERVHARDVLLSFKEWFRSSNVGALDLIFKILREENEEKDKPLSELGLRLSEAFVLEVLAYGSAKYDVLSCLKFFDWAGRQHGFQHTRATFHSIFKILAKAKLMPLMIDFLDTYVKQKHAYYSHGFHGTVVMGYALAGQSRVALQLFGQMRYQGIDLDDFTYHVLLNALVDEELYEAVGVISKQIFLRGFNTEMTHSIMVKSLCKQKLLDEAEAYLRGLDHRNEYGHGLRVLVDALCGGSQFERAWKLLEEFRELGVTMHPAYGVWFKNLVRSGKIPESLQFLQTKKLQEGYIPDVFRYNFLLVSLLKENRLKEVYDLLTEMKENQIVPDKVTMNAALCFFCKAGMIGIAMELYNSKLEFGLSPNCMAYNFLINSLCGDGSVNEALHLLQNFTKQGYFPGRRAFFILVDALCREGKLDKMKELFLAACQRNMVPSNSTYEKFISALCKARRVEDGYLMFSELHKLNKVASRVTYIKLILGFKGSNRGDIAARLLVEMQSKGYIATRALFRTVIECLLEMENPEMQFLKLLEMQLYHHGADVRIYNFFIEGAGHGKKPELAREVFEMMQRSGIKPNLSTDILMLQSYLKSERIFDALNFFDALRQRRGIGRKLYNTMVVGLCEVNRVDLAVGFLEEIGHKGVIPSVICYEALVQKLFESRNYDSVVRIIYDLANVGRRMTSFLGNLLLFNSMKSERLYETWVQFMNRQGEIPLDLSILNQLIAIFSGRVGVSEPFDALEGMIKQCFPPSLYTYNMLLRRLSMIDMELACKLFNRIRQRGYEPNKWTYDILVHGYLRHGKTYKALRWMEEMLRKGFDPTEYTKRFVHQ